MASLGTGAAITFDSGFFAEPLAINWSGISREAVETSHLGTAAVRTFIKGALYDPGELSVEIAFDPALTPAVIDDGAAETVTVTFADSGAATWAASGFITSFELGTPFEDRMTATATIKFTGAITITP